MGGGGASRVYFFDQILTGPYLKPRRSRIFKYRFYDMFYV